MEGEEEKKVGYFFIFYFGANELIWNKILLNVIKA